MLTSGPEPDQFLVDALKNGQQDALGRFYLDGKEAFVLWARKNFEFEETDIIDIYQDTIVIFYENILSGRYTKGNSSIKTYLYAIAKHLFYRKIQRDKREIERMPEVYDHYSVESFNAADEQKIQATEKAFASMAEPCKSILKLFYYQKLSMAEIAGRLGYKSDKVVKSQKVRCLKTLREETIKILGS